LLDIFVNGKPVPSLICLPPSFRSKHIHTNYDDVAKTVNQHSTLTGNKGGNPSRGSTLAQLA
jgi:hypothetical protein